MALVAVQFCGYWGLLVLVLPFLATAGIWRRWWGFVVRGKWLLLTLWGILAFNTPGESWLDSAWMPTYEGIAEANIHSIRLLVMLWGLAWLFLALGRSGLVESLWSLMQPFARLGLDVERLTVRLSLVLELMQSPMPKGAWRDMLRGAQQMSQSVPGDFVRVNVHAWNLTDLLIVMVWGLLMLGVVRL